MRTMPITRIKKQTNYNKVVNIAEDGEITVLDYIFDYENGSRGAVGYWFYPVSKKLYKQQTTIEALADKLEQIVPEGVGEIPYGNTTRWAEAIKNEGKEMEFAFDISYSHLWDYLREETALSEDEAYIFECVGGGRCFNSNYQGNFNEELSEVIRKVEDK